MSNAIDLNTVNILETEPDLKLVDGFQGFCTVSESFFQIFSIGYSQLR